MSLTPARRPLYVPVCWIYRSKTSLCNASALKLKSELMFWGNCKTDCSDCSSSNKSLGLEVGSLDLDGQCWMMEWRDFWCTDEAGTSWNWWSLSSPPLGNRQALNSESDSLDWDLECCTVSRLPCKKSCFWIKYSRSTRETLVGNWDCVSSSFATRVSAGT